MPFNESDQGLGSEISENQWGGCGVYPIISVMHISKINH